MSRASYFKTKPPACPLTSPKTQQNPSDPSEMGLFYPWLWLNDDSLNPAACDC